MELMEYGILVHYFMFFYFFKINKKLSCFLRWFSFFSMEGKETYVFLTKKKQKSERLSSTMPDITR